MFKRFFFIGIGSCLCTAAASADNQSKYCLDLVVQKLPTTEITFTYYPKNDEDNWYFYVKAIPENEKGVSKLNNQDDIKQSGVNLNPVPKTDPTYYQLNGKKTLRIVGAQKPLDDFAPSFLIKPQTTPLASLDKEASRSFIGDPSTPRRETKPIKWRNGVEAFVCDYSLP